MIEMTKPGKIAMAAIAAVAGLATYGAKADAASFVINYSGQGTSGTAYVTGTAIGGGEYDLTSGVLHSSTLGTETLVAPGSGVFQNTDGDDFTYDNRLFVPANAPASPDGANVTYAGGIVFQTGAPSENDIYFSAYNQAANNVAVFYFSGYNRSYGALDSFTVSAVPEPSIWAMMLLGVGMVGAGLRSSRRRLTAAVAAG